MATPSLAMIPSAIADSKVYSVLPNNGDGDFTFNRDSSATRVGQNGLIQTVGYFGSELITNGDFATDSDWTKGTSWTISGGVANYDNVASQGFYQAKVLLASVVYKVTFDYTGTGQIGFYGTSNGSNVLKTYTNYAGGSNTIYITPTSTTSSFTLWGNVTGAFTVDNVSVKEVLGDQPRLNYDISNGVVQSCPSLLLEPASTNLVPYSENFSLWVQYGSPTIVQNIISPDGTLNGSNITRGSNQTPLRYSGITTLGTEYTFSLYAKKGSIDTMVLDIGDETNVSFTLTDEWQRFTITQTPTTYTHIDISFGTSVSGDSIYIWGAQLEQLSYATSYIPTTGQSAGVTRAAESCFGAGTSSTFNSTEGVLYAEISGELSGTNRYITLSDSAISDRVNIFFDASNNLKGFVNGISSISGGVAIQETNKCAFKYKSGDIAFWVNGIEVGTSTATLSLTGLSQLSFNLSIGGNVFYGNVKDIRVYNEALTDAQLQTLTTL